MSVYKKDHPKYFDEALKSIWNDQKLKPAQIVLVKDGSITPELDDRILTWTNRLGEILTVVGLRENVGLGAALNHGLKYCNFELVARMDADDFSLPDRFLRQVDFMLENPDIIASSAWIEEYDNELGASLGRRILPSKHSDILRFSKLRSPLNHVVTIFRKSVVLSVGGYPNLRKAQDYALWSQLLVEGHRLANIQEVLLHARFGDALNERRGSEAFYNELKLLNFQRKIGFLSLYNYYFNLIVRFITRFSPSILKKLIYKIIRKA